MSIDDLVVNYPNITFALRDSDPSKLARTTVGSEFVAASHLPQGSVYLIRGAADGKLYCLYPAGANPEEISTLLVQNLSQAK